VSGAAAGVLRLGTRGSQLALRQAELVAAAVSCATETVVLRTAGDRGERGDKGRWVDVIEASLLHGEIDLAVHSAKDVPGELADGLELAGSPAREDARDALCGAGSLAALPAGARVGTSSLRRRAQLLALRDDLHVVELHGNLDTRLRRLDQGDFDAIVVALAGLRRLGRAQEGSACDELVPAPGQGTLALECRSGDERVALALSELRDDDAERALLAERTLVRCLGAGCETPLGAHARVVSDALELESFVGAPDGSEWIRDVVRGEDPRALGELAAERLLACGAGALLR
jgi:hydroxymethylbilane synthase